MTSFVAALLAAIVAVRVLALPATTRRWPFIVVVVVAAAVAWWAGPASMVLQKTLGRVVLPLGLLWAVLWMRTAWRAGNGDVRGALRVGAVAVAVTVVGNEPLGQRLMQVLEAPYQADPFSQAPFDAIIVLGGGAQVAPHQHFELGPAGDRIFLGARLFLAGKTPILVTTGSTIAGFRQAFDNTGATALMWSEVGVPAGAVVEVGDTRNTSEEARACARLIAERGWRRVGLVSSAWHLRRAEGLFRQAGIADGVIVPLAADHHGTPTWEGLFSMVPVGSGAWLQQKAAWELVGAAVGR